MADEQAGLVRVKIYDREFSFRTTGDEERLHKLCLMLDRRMREMAQSTGAVDTLKVAILTALGLSEELLRSQEELQKVDETLSRRSKECVSMLDRFL